jgi:hypothetical protein
MLVERGIHTKGTFTQPSQNVQPFITMHSPPERLSYACCVYQLFCCLYGSWQCPCDVVRSVLQGLLWSTCRAGGAVIVQRQHCAVAFAPQLPCVEVQLSVKCVMRIVGVVGPALHAAFVAARQFCAVLSFGCDFAVPWGVLFGRSAVHACNGAAARVALRGVGWRAVSVCGTLVCCVVTHLCPREGW